MLSPRVGSPRRLRPGRQACLRAAWAGLAVVGMLPSIGCQVEYGGMTLPSGKYMHDDVQYFPSGPEFPWSNTQAATQRARMAAMGAAYGLPPMAGAAGAGPAITPPPAPGAIAPQQNVLGRPTDVNVSPFSVEPPVAPAPAPPPEAGGAPAPAPAPPPAAGEAPVPPPPGG